MLRKLLKHEFRATGRIMGPLYLVLLATSVGMRVSIQVLNHADSYLLRMLGALLALAYVVAILGVCFAAFGLMIQRFYRSLLTDEGYLMFTLPVSVHQHIWSKLIVSTAWFFATGAAVVVSMLVMSVDGTFFPAFIRGFREMFDAMTAYYALNGTAIMLEFVVLCFLGCVPCNFTPPWRWDTAVPTTRWPGRWRFSSCSNSPSRSWAPSCFWLWTSRPCTIF